jgi:biotin carboxyl carrier protein
LVQLNRRYRLVLPDGAGGVVGEGVSALRVVAVEHGQPLFRLRAVEREWSEPSASKAASGDELAAGVHAVVSPTDGVFYRRPSPDAEPFVEVGSRVARGQPVGLVEVMKTFNQIVYGGAGVPDEAEVLEIRCGEAEEVRAGQPLIVLR